MWNFGMAVDNKIELPWRMTDSLTIALAGGGKSIKYKEGL